MMCEEIVSKQHSSDEVFGYEHWMIRAHPTQSNFNHRSSQYFQWRAIRSLELRIYFLNLRFGIDSIPTGFHDDCYCTSRFNHDTVQQLSVSCANDSVFLTLRLNSVRHADYISILIVNVSYDEVGELPW